MKTKTAHPANTEILIKLRKSEEQITRNPTTESYFKLADEYLSLGLIKESDRLMQLAEQAENKDQSPSAQGSHHHGLLSGSANPTMILEVIQILSRTKVSGELAIEAPAQTFRLFFDSGHVINAFSQVHSAGFNSFRMALRVPHGTYCFVEKKVDQIPRTIDEMTEILLLNALTDADKELAEKHLL
jgi:hypothetical protein